MRIIVTFAFLFIWNYMAYANSEDKMRLLSLLRQTEFYIIADNFEQAAELCHQSMAIFRKLGAENDNNTISELHKVSHAYSKKQMYGEAVKTESLLVEFYPFVIPYNKSDHALYLNDLSFYLLKEGNIGLAEKNVNKALSLIKNINDVDDKLATIYFRAAEIYYETVPQRIHLSIEYQKKAVDIYAAMFGRKNSKYLDELWYLAKYYEKAEEYEKACNAYLEIMHTRADVDNEQDIQSFLPVLDRIIVCSRKINNTKQEKQFKEIAFFIKIKDQEYHEAKYKSVSFPSINDSLDYVAISKKTDYYNGLQNQCKEKGEVSKIKQIEEAKDQYLASLPDTYGKAYSLSLSTLWNSWALNHNDVIKDGLNALKIFDNLGIITDLYVVVLCCVAEAYHGLHNAAKAYDYILKAYELRDDYLSSNHSYFNGIITDLSVICDELGNYRDAIKYGSMVVKVDEPLIYSDKPFTYFSSLNNLASYYRHNGQKDVEVEILLQLIHRAEEIDPSVLESPESPFLIHLADCYLQNKMYVQAIETGLKVKTIREQWGETQFLSNISILLAEAYRLNGQLEEALYYANQSIHILTKLGGDDNLSLAHSYDILARIYKDRGVFYNAEKMEKCSIELVYKNIINNFIDLSADDRTSYWNKYAFGFSERYPNYFYRAQIEDATELYNKSALFAKGILLNSDTELSKLIIESGDENAYAKFQRLLLNRSALNKLTSDNNSEAKISADSLRTETDRIERELIKECKVYGDYTASLKITWKDVQSALRPNDVAIEFLSFPLMDEHDSILGQTLYAALILRKSDVHPHCIILFEEEELDKFGNNFNDGEMYSLIWGKIDKYLSGIDNVYFSPAGKLHNINIEALPEIVGENNEKKYYRVSSTRLLAQSTDDVQILTENAILYGGIQYDAPISGLIADGKLYSPKNFAYRGDVENLDLRYGWDFLPGTLSEVNAIESALKSREIPTRLYMDTLGTEASFKSLDGQACKIIHIATHGFYYTESDSVKMKNDRLDYMGNQIDKKSRSLAEDLSLTRSGLLMAGCNNILRGYKLPDDIDDGILFAKEIANMNLKNVELTTLSSCDSGLGDVTGEGVYGLQRAFKKAGAQSILMSLHKIDDEATKILMVEFYKNLMSGKSKLQSLKDAQKYLRQVEDGKYDDPQYWASFILLDGIN